MKKSRSVFLAISFFLSLAACSTPQGIGSQLLPTTAPDIPSPTAQTINQDAQPESTPTDKSESGDQGCQPGSTTVALIVDPEILDGIRPGLTQFEADLRQQGFLVIEESNEFATPIDLRSFLIDLYASTDKCLTGVYLIGDIPNAYQWFRSESSNPDIPPSEQEVLSYQYYADLDGIFKTSEEYISPGSHLYSFDVHEGEMDWEI